MDIKQIELKATMILGKVQPDTFGLQVLWVVDRNNRGCRAPFNPKNDHKKGNKAPGVCKPQSLYNQKDRT